MIEQSPAETWLSVVGLEGLYQVSDLGRVRRDPAARPGNGRSRGHILSPSKDRYWSVGMHTPGGGVVRRNLHVLVAAAFLGPRPQGHEIAHLNDDPGDNRLTNLAYQKPTENRRHGPVPGHRLPGERNGCAKLTDDVVAALRTDYKRGDAARVAAEQGASVAIVYRARRGDSWDHVAAAPVRRALRAPGKLTAQQAVEIRVQYRAGSSRYPGNAAELAQRYGVSRELIYAVAHGRVWKQPESGSR